MHCTCSSPRLGRYTESWKGAGVNVCGNIKAIIVDNDYFFARIIL